MPFAIDEDRIRNQTRFDVSAAPNTPTGLPMKQIPHLEYPKVVYKHPKEPFRVIEHRNTQHEIVQVERVPSEHMSRLVADKKELEAALKDGWVKEPYVPAPPVDPNAELYT